MQLSANWLTFTSTNRGHPTINIRPDDTLLCIMDKDKRTLSDIKYMVHKFKMEWRSGVAHGVVAIRMIGMMLNGLTVAASACCILCLVAYLGYDRSPDEIQFLLRCFRIIQGILVASLLFDFAFNFKNTIKSTRLIKWIVSVALLVTILPIIYPRPEHPWIVWLDSLLYSNKFTVGVLTAYSTVTLSYGLLKLMGRRTNPSLLLASSFLIFIVAGSFLLMMPKCTYTPISYIDSLFVSTSAVCITGLTTIDIASTFTPLGLLILALLIQIGGLGVMTFTSFFALFFSGNTSVYSQLLVKDMIYTKSINALLPTLLYIFFFTIAIETAGAVCIWLSIHDVLQIELKDQIVFSAFHSVSAFCNAGFSNINGGMSNAALMNSNQWIYITISIIVMAGSIGFPVLVNFRDAFVEYFRRILARLRGFRLVGNKVHLYNVNTKLSLYATLCIFAISAVMFWIFERNNTLSGFNMRDQIFQSIFNATTPRSSGFVSVNPASFLNVTLIFTLFLMWIGGSSQSTAGGIKVNTLCASLINLRSIILGQKDATSFNRTISQGSIRRAGAVVILSIVSYLFYSLCLLALEPVLPAKSLLFESCSALFTVGSSLGITPELSTGSKLLLSTAMFLGRVGIISLLTGIAGNHNDKPAKYPTDNIIIN